MEIDSLESDDKVGGLVHVKAASFNNLQISDVRRAAVVKFDVVGTHRHTYCRINLCSDQHGLCQSSTHDGMQRHLEPRPRDEAPRPVTISRRSDRFRALAQVVYGGGQRIYLVVAAKGVGFIRLERGERARCSINQRVTG